MHITIHYFLFLLTILIPSIHNEYFTSSSHLKVLFQYEKELADSLKGYITKEASRLSQLKRFYEKVEHLESLNTPENVNAHIGNPVKSYLIIRRMVTLWPEIKKWTEQSQQDFPQLLSEYEGMFPSNDELSGAQDALLRLQETFSLSSNEIVEGIARNAPPMAKLEVDDAFDIGKKTFYKSEHALTATWMSEALRLLDLQRYSPEAKIPSRFEVLDHLAWSEYINDNLVSAYEYTKQLLKIEPDNSRIQNNKEIFKRDLEYKNIPLGNVSKLHEEQVSKQRSPAKPKKKRSKYRKFYYTENEDQYERYYAEKLRAQQLCRGEIDPIPKRFRKTLVCFFKRNHPLLVLKPAKVERLYPAPEILLFRDAMSDYEIQRVQEIAHPMLQRATVHNPATGKLEFADYRVSKSAWLDESHDELVEVMNKRIEAYTGLSMKTAEKLQVANYGIGGHYETHFDFARTVPLRPPPWKHRLNYTMRAVPSEKELLKSNGNRIATVLFYMTNVERGGATVFTNIGQAVRPSKGDAVFWHNLHHDGSGDFNTRHAACPVLIGEKWVSNRWIREHGQEFRRKCRLKPDLDYPAVKSSGNGPNTFLTV